MLVDDGLHAAEQSDADSQAFLGSVSTEPEEGPETSTVLA